MVSGWAATASAIRLQGPGPGKFLTTRDVPPDSGEQLGQSMGRPATASANELHWRLPPGGNRTPLEGVISYLLLLNTLGLQTMEQS